MILSIRDWQIYMTGAIFHPHTTSNPANTNLKPNPNPFNTNSNLNCNPNQNHTPRTENSLEQIQLSVPRDGKCHPQDQTITLIICATVRQLQTHYCVISHYTRSILVVLLRMILTISCMSTHPLHACQWLSNVSTPVSCNVYWLQSRVCTPDVGLLVMMTWLELCTSCSCSCLHHLSHSNKMQNGDILVAADPGLPGKMAVEMEREHLVVWSAVGVSDHTLCVLIDHLWDLVLPTILMKMADWSEP